MKDFSSEMAYLEQWAPKAEELFTNEEQEQKLVGFQSAICQVILSSGITERITPKDIVTFLERLAYENGVEEDETFQRLRNEMKNLGFLIGSLKKGAKGEKRTRDGLRNLEFSPGVKILYNITLDDGTDRTEYDAIVLTPYGIFVVEAKNFNGDARITEKGILVRKDDRFGEYNLGEKMNRKEFLLRSCLGDLASVPYHALLLYVNEQADIEDEYHQIPITYCNTVAKTIRQFDHGNELITAEELKRIETEIISHQIDARYPCGVDCQQIIEDLTVIMRRIANSEPADDPLPVKAVPAKAHSPVAPPAPVIVERRRGLPWWGTLLLSLGGAGLGAGGMALYDHYKQNRN